MVNTFDEGIDSDIGNLLSRLDQIGKLDHPNITVPEVDTNIFQTLQPHEIQIASKLTESALPVAEMYRKYVEEFPEHGNWNRFVYENAEYAHRVSGVFSEAAEIAYSQTESVGFGKYLASVSVDWARGIHRFHPLARSEDEFFINHYANSGSLAVRSSCGLERYIHPKGYNPSLNIRIGESIDSTPKMQQIQFAITNYLRAGSLMDKINFTFRRDNFILGAGHHGRSPSGSQYTKEIDGVFYVVVNSNLNIQRTSNIELESSVLANFTIDRLNKVLPAMLDPEIEVNGHEIAEVILEHMHAKGLSRLSGREPVELASTIAVLDALRIARNLYGDGYAQLYEDASWRIISRMILRRFAGEGNPQMLVYSKGFDLAMRIFEQSNAFNVKDGKIDSINWPIFDDAVHILSMKLLTIIRNGDQIENEKLFAILNTA